MDFQNVDFLKFVFNKMNDEYFNIVEQIKNEIEYIGYTSIIDSSIPTDFAIIIAIESNRWGTKFFTMYRPNNGEYENVKISKSTFEDKIVEEFDMIKTITIETKPKKRKIDGKWVDLEETENILTQYARVII